MTSLDFLPLRGMPDRRSRCAGARRVATLAAALAHAFAGPGRYPHGAQGRNAPTAAEKGNDGAGFHRVRHGAKGAPASSPAAILLPAGLDLSRYASAVRRNSRRREFCRRCQGLVGG
jgi:hypothetical protein